MEKDNNNEPHPDFVQGFNEGYFIAQEMPQFASDMARHMPQSQRGNGFGRGVQEYGREQSRQRQRDTKAAFKQNKGDIGVDKNSRENLTRDFKDNKNDMGMSSKDKYTDWLNDKDVNKQDMGIDKDYDKSISDKEPDMD